MSSIRVSLVRHAKVNGKPALYGHTDVAVAAERQQAFARALAENGYATLPIVSSPLRRCADLAKALQALGEEQSRGVSPFTHSVSTPVTVPVTIEPQWREISFGQFDGIPFDEVGEQWSALEAFWQHPAQHPLPGAETLERFYQRVVNAWQAFVAELSRDTLVVMHGGTIRMILAYVLGLDWQNPALFSTLHIENQSITQLEFYTDESGQVQAQHARVRMIGAPLGTG